MTTPVRTADLIRDLPWTPAGADVTGYHKIDYFGPLEEEYPTREAALDAIRAAYKGPDVDGIGLAIPERR